jgi:hypothetical protein
MFRKMGRLHQKNATFRGVRWGWFADQYTRKTDGVTVPAYGGVRRLKAGRSVFKIRKGKKDTFVIGAFSEVSTRRLKGHKSTGKEPNVRAKRRKGGSRVTRGSHVMSDSGTLQAAALTDVKITNTRLVMDTPVGYAKYVHPIRPFQFFEEPVDVNALRRFVQKAIEPNG